MASVTPISVFTPSNAIHRHLRPVLLRAKVLAVYPFVLDEHGAGSISVLGGLHTALMMALVGASGIYYVRLPHALHRKLSVFLAVMTILLLVISYVRKRKALWSALTLINQVSVGIWSLGTPYSFNRKRDIIHSNVIYIAAFFICAMDAYSFSSDPRTLEGIATIFCIYYFYFVLVNFYELFYCISGAIGSHFAKFNEIVTKGRSHFLKSNELGRLLLLHSCLCDASQSLQSAYSFPMLVVSAFTFFNATSNIYVIVHSVENIILLEEHRWDLLASKIALTAMSVSQFWVLLSYTCFIEEEAANLTVITSQLSVIDKRIVHNDFLNLLLAKKQKVSFWACGFFKMDKTVLFSMFAASATYITIMLQFFPVESR